MKKMYLVKYCGEEWSHNIFVTKDENKAKQYCLKFNNILKKWKKYYQQFEIYRHGIRTIDEKYIETKFNTWVKLDSVIECYYTEIELR